MHLLRSARAISAPVLKPVCAAALLAMSGMAHAGVVISQIYGGNGSTFASDYVELFNNGTTVENIAGWSIQYSSATGAGLFSGNGITALTGSLQPGQYYLAKLTTTSGPALPTADATGTTNVSSSAGKVVLVNVSTGLACNGGSTVCTSAQTAQIVDLVGFGNANYFEGTAAPALTSTTALLRVGNGCTDTNVNSADFAPGTPAPRNTATALAPCSGGSGGSGGGTGGTGGTSTPAAIHDIQGSGNTSPLSGQTVSTSGVVTKLSNNGFFLQDPNPDNNPATSEGIFVFTSTAPTVAVGQAITLSGKVAEFNTGIATNTLTATHTVTELTAPTDITVQSSGNSITPTLITLPATEAQLEAVEGMLVTVNTQLTASQNYFQGRYGQVTLSSGGRLIKPTNVFRAGTVDAINMAASNAQRQILLDDGTSAQNPTNTPYIGADNTLRAGDTIDSITGVIDYGLSTSFTDGLASYKIHPTTPVSFTRVNARTNAPASVGGNVKVASFNVLNYFTTFTNGATASGQTGQGCSLGGSVAAANCRGADTIDEFLRQRTKIVKALAALNADVVGLMEIQNNGNTAAQNLVDALNAEVGAGTYATTALPVPIAGSGSGTGTDAIRVAMIYKPTSVSLVGGAVSDIDAINNRPPLAQTFSAANGEKFTVVVNHFKSKGSCPAAGDADAAGNVDSGDGQGCWTGRRVQQATQLRNFISNLQISSADNDVLVIGDLNAYGKEDPIANLTGNGLSDLTEAFSGANDYSYVFDGEAGYLDHALATSSTAPLITGTAHWTSMPMSPASSTMSAISSAPRLPLPATCPRKPVAVWTCTAPPPSARLTMTPW
jgi:predicted extracellular nuclease